jgi:hypothetical protein
MHVHPNTMQVIAHDRRETIRREVALSRTPRKRGNTRRQLGLLIVGLGVRVAGPTVERGSLVAPPQAG